MVLSRLVRLVVVSSLGRVVKAPLFVQLPGRAGRAVLPGEGLLCVEFELAP